MLAPMPAAQPRFFVVPHTHWDREWYEPLEYFQLKLGAIVDQVLDTLERDPQFTTFTLDGQAIVLEDYVEVRPENEPRLRALIEAGRVEIGPSYVLPDEFLVGAEPLVRNLLIGRAVCERFGGRPSRAGYLPDSFGHPLQLPQILAGFGIDSFIFTRGLGDELDDAGVVFEWVAPDGTAVLALQQLPEYGNFHAIRDADDGVARVHSIMDVFGPALARAGVEDVLLCNGTDHLPIQPELPRWCRELEQRLPGASFTISRYDDYVAALAPDGLPRVSGELLGSRIANVLRGVNSARLYLKQANERAEQRLLSVETLIGLRALASGAAFPHADVTFAWRELLRCQPHDSICGCSCDEVHRDMLVRYEALHRTLDVLTADAAGRAAPSAVFNPLPFPRTGLMALPGHEPALVTVDGWHTQALPATVASNAEPRPGDEIENDRFRVQAAPDGTLTVHDLSSGRRWPGLHALQDDTDVGDLYNFCPVDGADTWQCAQASSRVLRDGPVYCELEVSYRGERPAGAGADGRPRTDTVPLSVITVVRLVQGSDRVEFQTTIDNAAADHRLRAVFPAGDAPGPVRAEGHFAVVRRRLGALTPRTTWREPPDPTQHAIGASALGSLALLTRGLPEYEARSAGDGSELCLTLLRCVGTISRAENEISTRPVCAGPPVATPEGQCLGRHVLEYALRFDADGLDDLALVRASQDYRWPLLAVPAATEAPAPLSLAGGVAFSCLKGAENGDGLVLRVFNPGAATARAQITGAVDVERLRLDETAGESIPDGVVAVAAGEIATLRLRRSARG